MSVCINRVVLIFSLATLGACSGNGVEDIDLGMQDNTTLGAATGGVVGAGLGAIVGNQVGDTGTGLVIGAAAGAGSGALIGNALDQQDARMNAQDEVLQQQERQLAADRSELDELRRMGQDNVSFKDQIQNNLGGRDIAPQPAQQVPGRASYNWPTRPASPYSRQMGTTSNTQTYATQPPMRPVERSEQRIEQPLPPALPRDNSVSERTIAEYPAANNSFAFGNPEARAIEPAAPLQNSGGWVQPEIRKIEPPQPAVQAANAEVQQLGAIVDQPVVQQPVVQQPAAALSGTTNLNSPECKQALGEANSASAAADPADKLFHYRRALRLCPDNANFHSDLGQVYLSLNRKEDARFEFQEALRLDPQLSSARSALGSL